MRSIVLSAVAALAATGAAAQIVGSPPLTSFPELTPRATLIAILKALDSNISDPRSVTDIVLCPPTRVHYSNRGSGPPDRWYVPFAINSRTSGGGFTGQVMYGAAFRAGKLPSISQTQMADDTGLNHLVNDSLRKQMRDCPRVSNEQMSGLLDASDRPVVDVSR